jgi:thiamine biosynthesis lipoprotein
MSTHKSLFRRPTGRLAAAFALALFAAGCERPDGDPISAPAGGNEPRLVEFSGPTMGTWFTVKLVDPPTSIDVETLEAGVGDVLASVDALMSTYRSDSELSRLNRFDEPDWFGVSPDTAAVIDAALHVGRLTGGAFDVTVSPLVNLWNFGPVRRTEDRVPSAAEIDDVMARIGFEKIEVRLSPPAVRKERDDLSIDLSGIAKGFAVDRVADRLRQDKIQNYMVDVGGEVKALGHNANGDPWRIGVESPKSDQRPIRVIPLDDLAVATSGDYRNYFEQDGVRYCHLIDPRSGRPIGHKLASVSVIGPDCARADALATALMVLGPDDGYNLAVKEDLAALFLVKTDAGFVEKTTPRFEKAFP